MPYLPVELDALNQFAHVAGAAGVERACISDGMLFMWAHVFRTKSDRVTATHVRGFFGRDVSEALVAFGFLEALDGAFRVKGADEYLLGAKADRRRGGISAKGNLIPGFKRKARSADVGSSAAADGAEGQPKASRSFGSSAPPNTQHPTPLKEEAISPDGLAAFGATPAPPSLLACAQPEKRAEPRDGPDTLRDRLEGVFQRVRGEKYKWRTADDNECRALLALGEDSWQQIERRWERGLRKRWPTAHCLADLTRHWNAYAGADPEVHNRGRASEADKDWSGPPPAATADGDVVF